MEKKQNHLAYLFAKTWRFSEGNRRNVACFWSMFVAAGIFELFFPSLIWAKIMVVIQKEGVTKDSIGTLLGLLALTLASSFVFWMIHKPARQMENDNAFIVRANYRRYLLQGVMTLPLGWHVEHHSGDTIDKIEKGANSMHLFSEATFQIIYSLVSYVGSFAVLAYFSPPSAVIVSAITAFAVWIIVRFDRVLIAQYAELSRSENKISERVFDAVSNIATVIILRVERLVFNAIMASVEKPFALTKSNNRISETKWFLVSMCSSAMVVVTLAVYLWQRMGTVQGVLVGTVFLVIGYLRNIRELFFRFADIYGDIVKRRTRIANAELLAKDFRPELFTNHVLPAGWKRLEIEGLDFSYEGSAPKAKQQLCGVSLALARGERVAFVGKSGSGKTTLLKVIRALFHPENMRLTVDGVPIREGFDGISRAIALVPQNPEIFATTIRENITLGADHDAKTIERFTDMACFTETAAALPKGLESSIKEKGVNLSGGQQQRLALSRGLLASDDKEIVLLDEPTSSLDTTNEMLVYKNIFDGFKGKTIVSSVHRLHLLPLFDRVCFFEDGMIIATGTVADLLKTCPSFQRLWAQYAEHQNENSATIN